MPDAALWLAIASSANTPLEENSTEIPLRGVLKKPHSLSRSGTLTTLQTTGNTVQPKSSMISQSSSKCRALKRHAKKPQRFRGCSLFLSGLKQLKTKNAQCTVELLKIKTKTNVTCARDIPTHRPPLLLPENTLRSGLSRGLSINTWVSENTVYGIKCRTWKMYIG